MNIKDTLKSKANKDHAVILQRFFKTGKGEYGEGDIFIGIKVPVLRSVAKEFRGLNYTELQALLNSSIHEERLVSLFILVDQFRNSGEKEREKIVRIYLKNLKNINNWDLVDLTADKILGAFLIEKDKKILFGLASSDNVWKKRVALLSTFNFIKENRFETAFEIIKIIIDDKHDLIHKASGWMLREIGKRDLRAEEIFLKKYYKKMPRTMLRYAIEKFPAEKREAYLKGKI